MLLVCVDRLMGQTHELADGAGLDLAARGGAVLVWEGQG